MSALTSVYSAAVSAVRTANPGGSAPQGAQGTTGPDRHLAELLLAAAARDVDAFEEFYRATNTVLFGILRTRLRSRRDVEAALVQTYVEVWRRADEFSDEGEGSSWEWTLRVLAESTADAPMTFS